MEAGRGRQTGGCMGERHITADLEGTNGRDTDEPFESYPAALEYAYRHGLELECAGSKAFEKWQRKLPPGAFELHTYRSKKKGLKTCGMFSQQHRHIGSLVEEGIVELDDNGAVRVLDEEALAERGGLTGYVRKQVIVIDE
jgi:hypothetical protein